MKTLTQLFQKKQTRNEFSNVFLSLQRNHRFHRTAMYFSNIGGSLSSVPNQKHPQTYSQDGFLR